MEDLFEAIIKNKDIVIGVIVVFIILKFVRVRVLYMTPKYWRRPAREFSCSIDEFYDRLEETLKAKQIPEMRKTKRCLLRTGGIFSGWRYYLRVSRKEHTMYFGAFSFGTDFIFSEATVMRVSLLRAIYYYLPGSAFLESKRMQSRTFYQLDTEYAFTSIMHSEFVMLVNQVLRESNQPDVSMLDSNMNTPNILNRPQS
ncbi:MAG: hypothetical protein AAF193_03845 [Bacteroidota bacterium]